MCLAALTMDGATLSAEQIRNAWNANPDGAGIAFFDANQKLQSFRTLSLAKFERAYARLVADGRHESPMAIHFRYATHGDSTIANVHPFRMDRHTLAIHNGMFPIETNDSRSDTCIFVTETLRRLGPIWFDDANLWNLVNGYCQGSYPNKMVILTDNPNAKFRAYVVNSSAGIWNEDETIWFSNRSCESSQAVRSIGTWNANSWVQYGNEDWNEKATQDETDEWALCEMCGEPSVSYLDETETMACFICGTCQACAFEWNECTCRKALRAHEQTDSQFALFEMR